MALVQVWTYAGIQGLIVLFISRVGFQDQQGLWWNITEMHWLRFPSHFLLELLGMWFLATRLLSLFWYSNGSNDVIGYPDVYAIGESEGGYHSIPVVCLSVIDTFWRWFDFVLAREEVRRNMVEAQCSVQITFPVELEGSNVVSSHDLRRLNAMYMKSSTIVEN